MPHYRTRAMLVARGAQPKGPDHRLPSRPVLPASLAAPIVNISDQVDPNVNVDVHVNVNVNADAPPGPSSPP